MVLKKSVAGLNTGNTVRTWLWREARRYVESAVLISNGKGVSSQLKYYLEENERIDSLHWKIFIRSEEERESQRGDWASIAFIEELVGFFVELDDDLTLNSRKYIPQSPDSPDKNKVLEILEKIKQLQKYQADVDSRFLDLGHSGEGALQITVTHHQESEYDESHSSYSFRTFPDRTVLTREVKDERKSFWQQYWHNASYHGVQRKTEVRRVRGRQDQVGWQYNTEEIPFTRYEHIHIIITEPRAPKHIKPPLDLFKDKLSKKCKGEKVKRQSYWNNIDRREVEDAIATRKGARERYLRRTNQRQNNRESRRKWRGVSPVHPVYAIRVPVGLPPDEAARYREFLKKRDRIEREKAKKRAAAIKHEKNALNAAKKKEKQSDTFLTSVPSIVNESKESRKKRVSICENDEKTEKDILERKHKEKKGTSRKRRVSILQNDKKTEKDILEKEFKEKKVTLHVWELVDDLSNDHHRKTSKVVLKTCSKHKNITTEQTVPNNTIAGGANYKHGTPKSILNGHHSSHAVQSNDIVNKARDKRKNGRKRRKEKAKLALETPGAKSTAEKSNNKKPTKENSSISTAAKNPPIIEVPKTPEIMDDKGNRFAEKLESFSDVSLAPISVVVKASSLRPSALLKSFGAQYHEGHVFPRMFTIDITDRVRDTVKMFRKLDAPFVEPLFVLLVEASYNRVDDMLSNSNLALTSIKVHLKADMPRQSLVELYQRMQQKVNLRLIYPLSKIIEYCVQMYNSLPYESHAGAVLVSPVGAAADERTRSQLDWLLALCHWSFQAHAASDAYLIFSSGTQALTMPRPTTSSLCRVIEDTRYQLPDKCDARLCERSPAIRLLSCQHAYCRKCLNKHVITAVTRKELKLVCQILGCHTVLDEAAVALALSLPQRKLQCVQQLDERLAAHPLWQWCPSPGCGRAVKLGGAGLLNSNVVVMCECGHTWCFHCRQEGHWPAPCNQAKTYRQLRKQDPNSRSIKVTPNLCEVIEVTCPSCNQKNKTNEGVGNGKEEKMNDSGLDPVADCKCRYELCRMCLDLQGTPLALSADVLNAKRLSVDSLRAAALPLLFYRCALEHRAERLLWSLSTAEIRASTILHKIKRSSRLRLNSSYSDTDRKSPAPPPAINSQSLVAFHPAPPLRLNSSLRDKSSLALPKGVGFFSRPTTSQPLIAGKQDTEKFFLITVQQFVHQCHVLLEFVYVYMMDNSVRKLPELTKHVLTLEAVVKKISQLVTAPHMTRGGILEELHGLHERGTTTMKTLTALLQPGHSSPTPVLRTPTLFKPAFTKLPPIGQSVPSSNPSQA